ncbi:hypothetical protein [Nitrosococcus halophilus]|uniref:hypothetical protein n=1 Tax=Nitrosococcus halophilus TaxID=133539 RepID=UPI0002E6D926|nr:hypothetical protein [Nitrosococcus halophilus]
MALRRCGGRRVGQQHPESFRALTVILRHGEHTAFWVFTKTEWAKALWWQAPSHVPSADGFG